MTFTCTVVFILIQSEAWGTLAMIASRIIGAVVFTASVIHGTLIYICKQGHHLRWSVPCQVLARREPLQLRYCGTHESLTHQNKSARLRWILGSTGRSMIQWRCRSERWGHTHEHLKRTHSRLEIREHKRGSGRKPEGNRMLTPYTGSQILHGRMQMLINYLRSVCRFHGNPADKHTCSSQACSHTLLDHHHTLQNPPNIHPHLGQKKRADWVMLYIILQETIKHLPATCK